MTHIDDPDAWADWPLTVVQSARRRLETEFMVPRPIARSIPMDSLLEVARVLRDYAKGSMAIDFVTAEASIAQVELAIGPNPGDLDAFIIRCARARSLIDGGYEFSVDKQVADWLISHGIIYSISLILPWVIDH